MDVPQGVLVKVKNYLRRSHDKLDDDLRDTIAACLRDLEIYGVKVVPTDWAVDPLILNAIKLYCKAEDTDDPVKAAAYRERFEGLKASLGMAEEYKAGEPVE